jgi:hypothetical protein
MKRSIPLRGSVGTIDTTRLSGLTEGQLKALAQLEASDNQEARENELRLVSSTLGPEDSEAAGHILMALAESAGPGNPAAWFLMVAAENLLEGYDPVYAFREGLAAYKSRAECSDCSPGTPKGGQK